MSKGAFEKLESLLKDKYEEKKKKKKKKKADDESVDIPKNITGSY